MPALGPKFVVFHSVVGPASGKTSSIEQYNTVLQARALRAVVVPFNGSCSAGFFEDPASENQKTRSFR